MEVHLPVNGTYVTLMSPMGPNVTQYPVHPSTDHKMSTVGIKKIYKLRTPPESLFKIGV